jgi:hypothetical protein
MRFSKLITNSRPLSFIKNYKFSTSASNASTAEKAEPCFQCKLVRMIYKAALAPTGVVIVCIFYYDEIKLNLFDPIYKRLSKG